jgi:hypothetical protein
MMNTTQIAEKLAHDEVLLSRERKYLAAAIDAALTKAIADERDAKWRPIGTAPKDEDVAVLVLDTDYGIVTVKWRYDDSWGGVWGNESFIRDGSIYDEPLIARNPTHWQPLPDPPDIRRDDTADTEGEQEKA